MCSSVLLALQRQEQWAHLEAAVCIKISPCSHFVVDVLKHLPCLCESRPLVDDLVKTCGHHQHVRQWRTGREAGEFRMWLQTLPVAGCQRVFAASGGHSAATGCVTLLTGLIRQHREIDTVCDTEDRANKAAQQKPNVSANTRNAKAATRSLAGTES